MQKLKAFSGEKIRVLNYRQELDNMKKNKEYPDYTRTNSKKIMSKNKLNKILEVIKCPLKPNEFDTFSQ